MEQTRVKVDIVQFDKKEHVKLFNLNSFLKYFPVSIMPKKYKTSHKKAKSKSKSKSKKKSHSKKYGKRKGYARLTKSRHTGYIESCRKRRSRKSCGSDPNCSWSSSRKRCYRGKQLVYAGPSLPM